MPNNPTGRTPDDQHADAMPLDIRNDELTFVGQEETNSSFDSKSLGLPFPLGIAKQTGVRSTSVGVELESNWLCDAVTLRH